MNKFEQFRDEYAFSSVKRTVEQSLSQINEKYGTEQSEFTESERGSLQDLNWEKLERQSRSTDWVSFRYDNTIVNVYVNGKYSRNGQKLQDVYINITLYESDHHFKFSVTPSGTISKRQD